MHEDTTQIEVRQTKRGIEIHSYNHERGKWLHVGTIAGDVYEKQANVLQKPKPSFCLMVSELDAILEHGATFLRVACQGRKYVISLADFQDKGEAYTSSWYGNQWRCELVYFQSIRTDRKRNAIIDNPVQVRPASLELPRTKQLSLFKTN